ncbi:transcriptional regulator algP [Thiomonas sp.]
MIRPPLLSFAALRRSTRLMALVVLALALQPLVWAQQPGALWVAVPYCTDHSAPTGMETPSVAPAHAASSRTQQTTDPRGTHRLLVLLNPAAALSAADALLSLPATHGAAATLALESLQRYICPKYRERRCTSTPQPPQLPRAPPSFSC